jgi:chromosomal replication initiation ATPase DnaA
MAEQFVLGLPVQQALDAENFMGTTCNAEALRLIEAWPEWPGRACVIAGPPGCGKSHLVEIWRRRSGARVHPASEVANLRIFDGDSPPGPLAIEDVDIHPLDETAFFHLLNNSREHGFDLLLTARTPPGEWKISLPDLRSRFRSLTLVTIGTPDDDLLRALFVKHFADRQLTVQPEVIDYLVTRMERSAAGVRTIVAALDSLALAQGRRITRPLARDLLRAQSGAPERKSSKSLKG